MISKKRRSYYFAYGISSQVLSGVGEGGPEVRVGVLPHDGGDVGVDQRLDESAEELHGLKHNRAWWRQNFRSHLAWGKDGLGVRSIIS